MMLVGIISSVLVGWVTNGRWLLDVIGKRLLAWKVNHGLLLQHLRVEARLKSWVNCSARIVVRESSFCSR